MAGDWIKMRTNLHEDMRVITIGEILSIPELHVIGCLWKLWAWADSQTYDGNALSVTESTIDRFTGVPGFASALRKVGWLEGRDRSLSFPRFAEHNGQTAKSRAQTAKRVDKHRNADTVTPALPSRYQNKEEKNREELKTKKESSVKFAFDSEEFKTVWDRWERHRIQTFKPVGEIEAEQQQFVLSRFGEPEAIRILEFSIEVGAKNLITNGDHNKTATTNGKKKPFWE